jgi:NAD(P)-dependent dehydrogenase (short-subunit alcohol dehydrogenase family)
MFNNPSHIVNISSMGGFQGSAKFPGLSAYSVSKGALSILTEALSTEFASKDIRVNALCLGAVQTEMFEEAFPGFKAPLSAEEMGHYIADFALTAHRFYNGKILPVSLEDPD